MYLSYDDYLTYGGTLDETIFNNYEFEAECIIDYYTFDRLKQDTIISDNVKRLIYAMVELAQKKSAALSLGVSDTDDDSAGYITRQSNDGVDTTYSGISASTLFSLCKTETNTLVKKYLSAVVNEAGQKVLFRGLYPGE